VAYSELKLMISDENQATRFICIRKSIGGNWDDWRWREAGKFHEMYYFFRKLV